EESGDGWNGPAPDASPLRLAQHDIFGEITGGLNRPTYHNQLEAVLESSLAELALLAASLLPPTEVAWHRAFFVPLGHVL
ncbi:MAG: hypothetical protein J4O09_14005, partial [Chloroflexi bacterium]|nr:hypothetical protein [Chloroflexota bacterium]